MQEDGKTMIKYVISSLLYVIDFVVQARAGIAETRAGKVEEEPVGKALHDTFWS